MELPDELLDSVAGGIVCRYGIYDKQRKVIGHFFLAESDDGEDQYEFDSMEAAISAAKEHGWTYFVVDMETGQTIG